MATQDRELQESLRLKVGVPLLYLHNAAPTLEQPSNESLRVANKRTKSVLNITDAEAQRLRFLKEKEGLVEEQPARIRRNKRKGGPNPLSCKSKKTKQKADVDAQKPAKVKSGQVEKKRKRLKVPKHVKEILKNEIKVSN